MNQVGGMDVYYDIRVIREPEQEFGPTVIEEVIDLYEVDGGVNGEENASETKAFPVWGLILQMAKARMHRGENK
eukprot:scaffold391_cov88-Skeletonema_dohrnii-CCMP3373.AAC.7